jgi:chromosome segregation ATPase
MTRVISAPPPDVIGQLSDLITLVLHADAVSKVVEDLKAASEEYHAEKLAYEVSIGDSMRAKQAADDAALEAENKQAEAARKLREQADSVAEVNSAKASLVSEKAAFDAERAAYLELKAKAEAALDEREILVRQAEEKLEEDRATVSELKSALEAKLAVLRA